MPLIVNVVPSMPASAPAIGSPAALPVKPCKSRIRIISGLMELPVWSIAVKPGELGSVSMVHNQLRCVHRIG